MQNDLIAQGLTLMALGMGVVFVFLALLVVITYLMSALIIRYFPQPMFETTVETTVETTEVEIPTSPSAPPDAHTLAIIREAIRQHRQS